MADSEQKDVPAPTDPRVVAMLAVLFGRDWRDKLNGDAVFEPGPMDTWVHAVEAMLAAADAADPLRAAIRAVVQQAEEEERAGAGMPQTRGE